MAKVKEKPPSPDHLTMSLFAPGMSALHRAGLGGLACTLHAMQRSHKNGLLKMDKLPCAIQGRQWDEDHRHNTWQDGAFEGWDSEKGVTFIDDDLLGNMKTEGASEEAEGSANVRRAVLEVTRAVSLTPWAGDVTFNAASPGLTPLASNKDKQGK